MAACGGVAPFLIKVHAFVKGVEGEKNNAERY